MLTFAVRNTLIVAGIAVIIGRSIGVLLGMISGYVGGTFDRVHRRLWTVSSSSPVYHW